MLKRIFYKKNFLFLLETRQTKTIAVYEVHEIQRTEYFLCMPLK